MTLLLILCALIVGVAIGIFFVIFIVDGVTKDMEWHMHDHDDRLR